MTCQIKSSIVCFERSRSVDYGKKKTRFKCERWMDLPGDSCEIDLLGVRKIVTSAIHFRARGAVFEIPTSSTPTVLYQRYTRPAGASAGGEEHTPAQQRVAIW
jgi:hypothetical protein